MFNNLFYFKKKTIKIKIYKNDKIIFKYNKLFKYDKLDINTPNYFGLNFKITSVVTPFYYAFFKLFWDFKRKKYKNKKFTNVQYYFFFFLRDKKSKLFYMYLNKWFYYFPVSMHKRLSVKILKGFYNFYPLIKEKYPFKFVFKGKFKGKGNNKKKKWILKNDFISFVKKRHLKKIVFNANRTHHGAISSKTFF